MQTPTRPNTPTIIRFSSTWWIYMIARGGILRAIVNGTEDALAITGRTLLLIYLVYCGAKAGAFLVAPNFHFSVWQEMTMFILQVGGLEGSIPGLARRAKVLRESQDEEGANKVNKVMLSARILMVASIAEGALHSLHVAEMAMMYISAALLIVRGIVITGFLIELAKMDSEGPRVLSRDEHEREREAELLAGEQAREISNLRSQLEAKQEQVSYLQEKLEGIPDVEQAFLNEQEQVATLQGQLLSEQRTVSTLRIQLGAEQKQVESLQEELNNGQGDVSVLRRQLHATNLQITDLTAKLETANVRISRLQNADQETANLMAKLTEKDRELVGVKASLQTAKVQVEDLQKSRNVQSGNLQNVAKETANLTAKVQERDLQIADLQANVQTAKGQIERLQTVVDGTANLTAKYEKVSAELQSAKLQIVDLKAARLQSANLQNQPAKGTAKITSIETARSKITHAEVLAYMTANPGLKRAEVAANLGISERKVYDAVAWGKEQEAAN